MAMQKLPGINIDMLRALKLPYQIQESWCRTKTKQSESASRGRAQWPRKPANIQCFWGSARIRNNIYAKASRNQENMLRALKPHSQIKKFECRTKQKQSESASRGRAQWPGNPLNIRCCWVSALIRDDLHAEVTRNQGKYAPLSGIPLPNQEIRIPNQKKTIGIHIPGPCPRVRKTFEATVFLGVRADSEQFVASLYTPISKGPLAARP